MSALTRNDHVVVVGAGLAGWRFVEGLRREGFDGQLSLVGDEPDLPYDRPPLSKQVLSGKWEVQRTQLATMDRLAELDVAFRGSSYAAALDVENRSVTLTSGDVLRASRVVIATGVRARQLSFSTTRSLHTVRTLGDVERLRHDVSQLEPETQVVVIGGGFIGAEAATSLAALGMRPVVIEAMARPLMGIVGNDVSTWLASLAEDAGIELRTSAQVRDVIDDGDNLRVELADGSVVDSPVVVVAVGAVTNTEWLDDSGLEISGGVVVDDHLRSRDGVYAIGDVARFTWRHQPFVDQVRIEHWQCANDHAQYLATDLMAAESSSAPIAMVPYFWSDQYGKKIQMLGHPAPTDDVTMVSGSREEAKWLAIYARDGLVTGLIALNQPRALMMSRDLVAQHETLETALERQPWL